MRFVIFGEYLTLGPDAYLWGEPEARLDDLLAKHGAAVVGVDAGTVLATGDRDVQYEVEAESAEAVMAALDGLPATERMIWKVT
jgi:hypothetical protein